MLKSYFKVVRGLTILGCQLPLYSVVVILIHIDNSELHIQKCPKVNKPERLQNE